MDTRPELPLRICFAQVDGYGEGDASRGDSQFSRMAKDSMHDKSTRYRVNVTWVKESGMGSLQDPESFRYDGCIGSIQRNESDTAYIAQEMTYFGPNVLPWGILSPDRVAIGTAYKMVNKTTDATSARVMDFLEAYSHRHWIVTVVIFALIALLIAIRLAKYKKKHRHPGVGQDIRVAGDTMSLVTSCTLNQHSGCTSVHQSLMINYLYTLMTLLGFFTAYFLTSMIKTEMVALKRPDVYQTYEDILDHDVIPIWVDMLDEQRVFRLGRSGSVEKRIWERAKERGINQSVIVISNDAKEGGRSGPTFESFIRDVFSRRSVWLSTMYTLSFATSNICAYARANMVAPEVESANTYVTADPGANEFLRVNLGSKGTTDHIQRYFIKRMTYQFEGGTVNSFFKQYQFQLASPEGIWKQVAECMSNVILMPDPDYGAVPLQHYWDLLTICVISLAASLIVLFKEDAVREAGLRLYSPIAKLMASSYRKVARMKVPTISVASMRVRMTALRKHRINPIRVSDNHN